MGGGVCKVIFMSNPTVVLRLDWGFDNICYKKIAIYYLLSVTCYMFLAISIFLSETCYFFQKLVPFARCCTSRNFFGMAVRLYLKKGLYTHIKYILISTIWFISFLVIKVLKWIWISFG